MFEKAQNNPSLCVAREEANGPLLPAEKNLAETTPRRPVLSWRYRRYILAMSLSFLLILFVTLAKQNTRLGDSLLAKDLENLPLRQDNIQDVRNRTLGFEKLLVISMPNRDDKKDVWALASLHTDLDVVFVDGINGADIPLKAIPSGWDMKESLNTLGCFRGHLNALQKVVRERISSALIFEDDADWDVMLKSQLVQLAKGTRYLQGSEISSNHHHSPYGDNWDVLWLGHCGIRDQKPKTPNYWVIEEDPSAPPLNHRTHRRRDPNLEDTELQGKFTRVFMNPGSALCAFAYAVSLKGAEKLLYQFSVEPVAPVWDRALSAFCEKHLYDARCVAVHPAMFESYRAPGNASHDSDRLDTSSDQRFRKKGETANIAFPVKVNLERFLSDNGTIPSQWPEDTMYSMIDPREMEIPEGQPMDFRHRYDGNKLARPGT